MMTRLLLAKDYKIPEKPKLIENQMNTEDKHGNNPLHKAFRFRNDKLVKLLLIRKVGSITSRNKMGRLPLEVPHNSVLSDRKLKAAIQESIPAEEITRNGI